MLQNNSSPIPQHNRDAALMQTKMNIRILALKHAMKLTIYNSSVVRDDELDDRQAAMNAVEVVAQAGIIEAYLLEGILTEATPATVGQQRDYSKEQ